MERESASMITFSVYLKWDLAKDTDIPIQRSKNKLIFINAWKLCLAEKNIHIETN